LDTYSGAAVAYSLRKLSSTYSGSCIRVRRSSDNTEQDIGFVNNVLDTTSLLSFVGAGNGFVTTWYDQSGNNYNVINTTSNKQPSIVEGGSIITKNGLSSLNFDGSNDSLYYSGNFLGGASAHAFSVSAFENATRAGRDIIYGLQDITGTRYDFLIARLASNEPLEVNNNLVNEYIEGDPGYGITYITDTIARLFDFVYVNGSKRTVYINNVLESNGDNYNLGNLDDGTNFIIGADINGASHLDGKIQEIIIYNSDQSLNRSAINTDIISYYNIFAEFANIQDLFLTVTTNQGLTNNGEYYYAAPDHSTIQKRSLVDYSLISSNTITDKIGGLFYDSVRDEILTCSGVYQTGGSAYITRINKTTLAEIATIDISAYTGHGVNAIVRLNNKIYVGETAVGYDTNPKKWFSFDSDFNYIGEVYSHATNGGLYDWQDATVYDGVIYATDHDGYIYGFAIDADGNFVNTGVYNSSGKYYEGITVVGTKFIIWSSDQKIVQADKA
jgi:hypothetical protein